MAAWRRRDCLRRSEMKFHSASGSAPPGDNRRMRCTSWIMDHIAVGIAAVGKYRLDVTRLAERSPGGLRGRGPAIGEAADVVHPGARGPLIATPTQGRRATPARHAILWGHGRRACCPNRA